MTTHVEDLNKHPVYMVTTGTLTAYTITITPVPTSFPDGFGLILVLHTNCGASPTITINNIYTLQLLHHDGTPFVAGELVSGRPYEFRKIGDSLVEVTFNGWKDLGETTVSNGASAVNINIPAGAKDIEIFLNEVMINATAGLNMKVNNDGSSNYHSNFQYGANLGALSTAAAYISLSNGVTFASGVGNNARIRIQNIAGYKKEIEWSLETTVSGGVGSGLYNVATPDITQVNFVPSTGTFTGGKIYVRYRI